MVIRPMINCARTRARRLTAVFGGARRVLGEWTVKDARARAHNIFHGALSLSNMTAAYYNIVDFRAIVDRVRVCVPGCVNLRGLKG